MTILRFSQLARRELGITLAAFPNDDTSQGQTRLSSFRLVDEGLTILTKCATKRHFKLQPIAFQKALAQSLQYLLKSSSSAEVERVTATLGASSVAVDTLSNNEMWHDLLTDSRASVWASCKASPGPFIVSCDCNFPNCKDSVGSFAFCGSVDAKGGVTVNTSLRLVAAMLVVLDKFLEVISENQTSKRRRV